VVAIVLCCLAFGADQPLAFEERLDLARTRLEFLSRDNLLAETRHHAEQLFRAGADRLDLNAVVDDAWNHVAMDPFLARAVAQAVHRVDERT